MAVSSMAPAITISKLNATRGAGPATDLYPPGGAPSVIRRERMQEIAGSYGSPRVGVLGSHSALEIMDGAKDEGLETLVVCQRGREGPYLRYGRLADEVEVLDKFSAMLGARFQKTLLRTQTLLVPHRALTAYLGYAGVEDRLRVPLLGNRSLLRAEERGAPRDQYHLLRRARIRHPRIVRSVRGPVIVKVQEKRRKLERAFFTASSEKDYLEKCEKRLRSGLVSRSALASATIEELVIGAHMNFNFFASPLTGQCDFMGIERRLQTNVSGYVGMPAREQLELDVELQNIEVGHTPASVRESFLEQIMSMGERFSAACRKEYPPGIIGPFSLQGIITADMDIVVYDVSLRVPGNPILATTSPYTKYQYGSTFGVGRRLAMEISEALRQERLAELVT